ncbi:hypothetical protein MRX96_012079 [Rhipicephalus microplus]
MDTCICTNLRSTVTHLSTAEDSMRQPLGMNLLVMVATAIAVIMMAPNEASALGGYVGGSDAIEFGREE